MELTEYCVQDGNPAWDFITIAGRTAVRGNKIHLFWSASGIECDITASELWIEFEADYRDFEPWIEVYINGFMVSRHMIYKGISRVCIFRGMNKEQVKHVCVRKATQAMNEDPQHRLSVCRLFTDGQFSAQKKKSCRIEFIGDSITTGEGLAGAQNEWDWISMYMSTCGNYALAVSTMLNADFRIISRCGWGVVCGWNNDPRSCIPQYYKQICGTAENPEGCETGAQDLNDFASWQPDVVVINLGTNDSGSFDQPPFVNPQTGLSFKNRRLQDGTLDKDDTARYMNAVCRFLQEVRALNPSAFILWAEGMLDVDLLPFTKTAVEQFAEQTADTNVQFLRLDSMTDETAGSRGHPGPLVHKAAADKIAAAIQHHCDFIPSMARR